MFSITVTAENMDDAMDIYGNILNTRCRLEAHARLDITMENGQSKALSYDEVKRWGNGHAGSCGEIHAL